MDAASVFGAPYWQPEAEEPPIANVWKVPESISQFGTEATMNLSDYHVQQSYDQKEKDFYQWSNFLQMVWVDPIDL